MLRVKLKNLILFVNIILFTSCLFCSTGSRKYGKINIKMPPGIIISENDIKSIFNKHKNNHEKNSIDVVIYHFSPGSEQLIYSGENQLLHSYKKAKIQILLKFKNNKFIEDIVFITASGENKDEILRSLSFEIEKIIHN